MSSNSKKKQSDENLSKVEEPAIEYGQTLNEPEMVTDKEWDEMPDVLKKLLEKGIQESEQGLGISHEEMMKRIKAKYPFINGI